MQFKKFYIHTHTHTHVKYFIL